ncbi:hypothetical protein PIB30_091001, partial [Stylosanthes scabra]|nr:hypothetical protein [Stylosanthes scabra]
DPTPLETDRTQPKTLTVRENRSDRDRPEIGFSLLLQPLACKLASPSRINGKPPSLPRITASSASDLSTATKIVYGIILLLLYRTHRCHCRFRVHQPPFPCSIFPDQLSLIHQPPCLHSSCHSP